MASQLMTVCMSLQDLYGGRLASIQVQLAGLAVPGSPHGRELSELCSLYSAIIVCSINAMPEIERAAAAARLGIVIDRADKLSRIGEETLAREFEPA